MNFGLKVEQNFQQFLRWFKIYFCHFDHGLCKVALSPESNAHGFGYGIKVSISSEKR